MRGRMWAEIISTVEEGGGAAPHHLLGLFQISLHDLLTRFLTGIWDLERLSKVVFPQRFFFTSHALTRTLLDLRTLLSGLEKGGVAVSGKLREALGRTLPGGAIRAEELARFVSEGYLFLSGSIERCGGE